MKSGIYTITNIVNGKINVGYATIITNRWNRHRSDLRHNKHSNDHLQAAWNKYGEENFLFEVLVECEIEYLTSLENYWCNLLDTHNPKYGYNKKPTGPSKNNKLDECSKLKIGNANRGRKCTEETKRKIAESNKKTRKSLEYKEKTKDSYKNCNFTKEAREKGRIAKLGSTISEEHKLKLSIFNIGKKHTQETKNKIAKTSTGKKHPHTEEMKKYLSDISIGRVAPNKGKKTSQETIKKAVNTRTLNNSYKNTEEQKQKISDSLKGRKRTQESINKMIQTKLENKLFKINQNT